MKNLDVIYNKFLKSEGISIDTRQNCKKRIFFALKGKNFNGNIYADEAIKKGASVVIIDEKKYKKNKNYILVSNSLKYLQKVAQLHIQKSKFKVIAITGTNGKTTTKEIIYKILKSKFKVSATKKNLNNHIGVPLTILAAKNPKIQFLIVEMGANHENEIKKLCQIAQPQYGIITNIGKAHLEGFKSEKNIIKTKKELYDYIKKHNGKIFINKMDAKLIKISEDIEKIYYNEHQISCKEYTNNPYLEMKLLFKQKNISLKTKLIGEYNINNILSAICIGDFFNININKIKYNIEKYQPKINRSQLIKTNKKNTVILDAYNANPTSMESSINSFNNIKTNQEKILIIGDMMELGASEKAEHVKMINIINKKNIKNVFLCGKIFNKNCSNNFLSFKTKYDIIDYLINKDFKNKMILIKGSRSLKLEEIVKFL